MMMIMMKTYHKPSFLGENNVKNKSKLNQELSIWSTYSQKIITGNKCIAYIAIKAINNYGDGFNMILKRENPIQASVLTVLCVKP